MPRKQREDESTEEYKKHLALQAKAFRQRNPGYGAKYKTKWRQEGKAKARMRKQKLLLIDVFGGKCQCCKKGFHHSEFDFHHTSRAEKERSIQPDRGWSTLAEEAAKCVLLCANCHRLYHYYERNKECETLVNHPFLPELKRLFDGLIQGPSQMELLKAGTKLSPV